MAQGVFITGTDTGIGKTIASGLLIDALIKQGHTVAGMKPVASGAKLVDGTLKNDDALHLIQHSNVDVPYQLVNPFCFEPAIAPHIAAQQAGREISTAVIGQTYRELSRKVDWIVVEGVGGWMVPLNVDQSVADIPLSLNLPVIMVVGMRLGCINHAMLTAEAVRSKGCNLSGWIANRLEPEMDVYEENLHTLRAGLDCPFLGAIPHLDHEENDPNQNITINIDVFKS